MPLVGCQLAASLLIRGLALLLPLISLSLPLYSLAVFPMQDCELYSTAIGFTLTSYEPGLYATAYFSTFEVSSCREIHPTCPLFCANSRRYTIAGHLYTALILIPGLIALLSFASSMRRLKGKRGCRVRDCWLLIGPFLSCALANCMFSLAMEGDGEAGAGLAVSWAGVMLGVLGMMHYLYMWKKAAASGLQRIRTSELEGTHIDPTRAKEEFNTEPSADEKKAVKHRKEVETLKERLESEETARKSLLADNQQLVRQVEEREKSLRDLEQKLSRNHQSVQVTAALTLAKQKEEEVVKLIGRVRDTEDRLSKMGVAMEELRGKVASGEKEKAELRKALEEGKREETGDTEDRLREELQAARLEVREKEREVSLILRTAQKRESEELQSLTRQVQELQAAKEACVTEVDALKRENEDLKRSVISLSAA